MVVRSNQRSISSRFSLAWGYLFLLLPLVGCQSSSSDETVKTQAPEVVEAEAPVSDEQVDMGLSRELLERFPAINDSKQLVIVETTDYETTTGTLSTWVREGDGAWRTHWEAIPINIGKTGFAAPGEKREGDGKSPSGLYALGPAFGYEADLDTEVEFIELDDRHYWMSAPDSANYNQLLLYQPATKEAEVMRRSDELYRYGLVVQYNMDPAIPGHGSAIFLHVQRGAGKPTLGCVSMEQQQMAQLIEWLTPASNPMISNGASLSSELIPIAIMGARCQLLPLARVRIP